MSIKTFGQGRLKLVNGNQFRDGRTNVHTNICKNKCPVSYSGSKKQIIF